MLNVNYSNNYTNLNADSRINKNRTGYTINKRKETKDDGKVNSSKIEGRTE